ncbi:MAG: DUF4143 domain-containing protein [Bacteroidia bacterium]|nr:DUF4143 domain-containing protein [Bacteroidia bacterium]
MGLNLKLLVDNNRVIKIFITGSSSFDLINKISEPLTGRSKYINLYPLSQLELNEDYLTAKQNLENKLIYGCYPEIITKTGTDEKIDELESIKKGYLLKDILELNNQKDSLFILNLLRLIAFQIGNDISYSELASNLNVNKKTVQRYLDIFEKTYVLFSLLGFSRNLRNEYTKTPRFYFWDNGIRNAVINNYNLLNTRDDIGKLWENYCISERLKKSYYMKFRANHYFWRTYDQKEIDLIEERDGNLYGYEMKWKSTKAKEPVTFLQAYPGTEFRIINNENFLDFIG